MTVTRETLDRFLTDHGFDLTEIPTDKEKLQALRTIAFKAGVDKDYDIMVFENKDKTLMTQEEYKEAREKHLDRIHNFEFIELNANMLIGRVQFELKETRKLKRKESFQKVLSVFRPKKR